MSARHFKGLFMSSLWRSLVIVSFALFTGVVACQPKQVEAPSVQLEAAPRATLSKLIHELKIMLFFF